jgi:diguanylate cyclase (GGDEF)-like protein
MPREPTAILQHKIGILKAKLRDAIDLSQKNLSAFKKFKDCSQEIQSITSLDQLPRVLENIRSRLCLQDIFLTLSREDYQDFVPLSIRTRSSANLKALMTDMGRSHADASAVRPVMGALADVRRMYPSFQSFLPQDRTASQDGSICVFFLTDKYRPQAVIGLLCLVDENPSRFHAGMATDFIEFFADSFAWALATLREHEKLTRENTLDHLTGCHNRTYLWKHAPRILEFAQRKGFPVALLFIDLDKFKNINDSLGHTCGDLVLIAIAKQIQRIVREYDISIRLGGDEFLVLLPDVDQRTAIDTAERIQNSIPTLKISEICGQDTLLKVSASIGVVMYEHGENLEQFIARADRSMYATKNERH